MKKIFTTERSFHNDLALLVARVTIGLLMLSHGIPKMQLLFSGDPIAFPAFFGMSAEFSLALTVFAEVVCSFLLLVGFATRLAVFPLLITMLVAVFVVHAEDAFTTKEPGVLYLSAYIVFLIAGSGKYSLDQLLQPKTQKTYNPGLTPEDPTLSIYQ